MKGIHIPGERVSLSPVSIKDAKILVSFYNEAKHFLGAENIDPVTLEHEKNYICESNDSVSRYFFAIRLNKTGDIIGTISVFDLVINSDSATTGTLIGLDYVDKGYGTEAKHILLDWIFNKLKLKKIYSRVLSSNPRSHAYALKCGYREDDLPATKKLLCRGRITDGWTLYITKSLWETRAPKKYVSNLEKE
jgi:ribosomal-protein-alanine N-acetyltransferase